MFPVNTHTTSYSTVNMNIVMMAKTLCYSVFIFRSANHEMFSLKFCDDQSTYSHRLTDVACTYIRMCYVVVLLCVVVFIPGISTCFSYPLKVSVFHTLRLLQKFGSEFSI